MASDLTDWPEVPAEQRPKRLYIMAWLPPDTRTILESRGWEICDVRLLPNTCDADQKESVKAILEGARLGTISLSAQQLRNVELCARICGMTSARGVSDSNDVDTESSETIDALLSSFAALTPHPPTTGPAK